MMEEDDLGSMVFTVDEARILLGISRHSAYEAVRRGQIPSIRIGRRILIPRAGLLQMLECPVSAQEKRHG